MKATILRLVALALALALTIAIRAGDVDDGPSGQVSMQPLIWEPIIADFYVVPVANVAAFEKSNTTTEFRPQGEALVGEWESWKALRRAITSRESFGPDDTVLSGWRRATRENGAVYFQTCGTHTEPKSPYWDRAKGVGGDFAGPESPQLFTVYAPDGEVIVTWSLDVLTNIDDVDKRERMLRDQFKLLELSVTAHRVSNHMHDYRGCVPQNNTDADWGGWIANIKSVGGPTEIIGDDFAVYRQPYPRASAIAHWDNQHKEGVWEFRIKARVAGRANTIEDLRVKTVEGAIRIAFWDNRAFTADRLSFSQNGKK